MGTKPVKIQPKGAAKNAGVQKVSMFMSAFHLFAVKNPLGYVEECFPTLQKKSASQDQALLL